MNTEQANAVVTKVIGRIAPEADLTRVARDADLQQELDLDSMDFLSLVNGVFDETGVEIPERDYPELLTLDGWAGYLARRAAAP